ncbi:hypothetical protein C9J03_22725 [Photobacterium gaetbulicola]|nr:hypothetical protein [Photobacterium gaetbulicola]PSU02839.1 hypothetical protein C9J03_22725 [Photobacterium gaetbulicola]
MKPVIIQLDKETLAGHEGKVQPLGGLQKIMEGLDTLHSTELSQLTDIFPLNAVAKAVNKAVQEIASQESKEYLERLIKAALDNCHIKQLEQCDIAEGLLNDIVKDRVAKIHGGMKSKRQTNAAIDWIIRAVKTFYEVVRHKECQIGALVNKILNRDAFKDKLKPAFNTIMKYTAGFAPKTAFRKGRARQAEHEAIEVFISQLV